MTSIGKEGRKYSVQGRTPYHKGKKSFKISLITDTVNIIKKQAIPGPGTYEPKVNLDSIGVYHLSNLTYVLEDYNFCYRNSKAPNISPRGERFKDESKKKKFIPGPGSYEIRDYNDGNYILSQFKNAGVRRFGTAARMQMKLGVSRETPGPGAYRPPSDFGYLEVIKSPRTSQSPR